MSATPLILLAAEEPALRAFLADNLTADGYRVLVAEDKPSALTALATHRPALAILDVNGDTLGLLDAVRAGDGVAGRIAPDTPLMVLTARAEELERVRLYERGSDDVLAKPFSYPELRARLRALLRRAWGPRSQRALTVGPLRIDPAARTVTLLQGRAGAAVRARRRADARVHQARAAARRLGLPLPRAHPHRGLARLPAAQQAARRRRPRLGGRVVR